MAPVKLPCGHTFEKDAILAWLAKSKSCPFRCVIHSVHLKPDVTLNAGLAVLDTIVATGYPGFDGEPNPNATSLFEIGFRCAWERKYEDAIACFEKHLAQGKSEGHAHINLHVLYILLHNQEKAMFYLDLAATSANGAVLGRAGLYLLAARRFDEALKVLQTSAKSFPPAHNDLGLCYHYGFGTKIEPWKAFKHYKKAIRGKIDTQHPKNNIKTLKRSLLPPWQKQ